MLNTKLILVDGITGSGKSTTAHFIARQLEKNGIKAEWFEEGQNDHPLAYSSDIEDDVLFRQEYFQKYPQKWINLAEKLTDGDTVYIIECYLFQRIVMNCLYDDIDKETIKAFYNQICLAIKVLNPVVINFYQKDVDRAIRENWQRRGDSWKKRCIEMGEESLYFKNKNLTGEIGELKLCQEQSDISLEVFNELEFKKLLIENSEHNWDDYRKQIMNFLEVPQVEETLYQDSFGKFHGYYVGKYYCYKIHTKSDRLCLDIDIGWPNIKLIPLDEDKFQIEGSQEFFNFISDESNEVKSLKIIHTPDGSTVGDVLNKAFQLELSETELEKFCGEFRCESKKMSRRIYCKGGKLYYWRSEESESELIPVSPTQLFMYGGSAFLNFEFNDDLKQFILIAKDQDDLIFVQSQTV